MQYILKMCSPRIVTEIKGTKTNQSFSDVDTHTLYHSYSYLNILAIPRCITTGVGGGMNIFKLMSIF